PRRRPVGESGGRARSSDMLILEFVMPDRLHAQSPLGRLGRPYPARRSPEPLEQEARRLPNRAPGSAPLALTRGRLTGSVDGYRTACRRGPARGGFERESVPTSPR